MKKQERVLRPKIVCESCGVEIVDEKRYIMDVPDNWSSRRVYVCAACYLINEKRLADAMHKKHSSIRVKKKNALSCDEKLKNNRKIAQKKDKKEEKMRRKKEQAILDRYDETKMPVI